MDHAPDRNRQNLAEALYRNGEIAEAKNLYEGLFAAGCRNFAVCLNLANLRVRAGETTAALACLRLALEHCRPGSSVHGDIEKNIRFLESRQ
jgi:hypothetical protein